jgi:F-type H+-transporting ATPase subunit b
MRRLLIVLLLATAPVLFAQVDKTGGTAAHGAASEAHEATHGEQPGKEEHHEKLYFGFIPGWILKSLNMILFIGVLVYFVGGPVKKGFAARSEAIRRAADEARERREKADRMAGDIQARLAAIEAEVEAIHERALAEGERQKRELIAAAEAESQSQLASERAEQILREKITEQDQKKLFEDSLREVSEVRA